jgi:hypothetical protein
VSLLDDARCWLPWFEPWESDSCLGITGTLDRTNFIVCKQTRAAEENAPTPLHRCPSPFQVLTRACTRGIPGIRHCASRRTTGFFNAGLLVSSSAVQRAPGSPSQWISFAAFVPRRTMAPAAQPTAMDKSNSGCIGMALNIRGRIAGSTNRRFASVCTGPITCHSSTHSMLHRGDSYLHTGALSTV